MNTDTSQFGWRCGCFGRDDVLLVSVRAMSDMGPRIQSGGVSFQIPKFSRDGAYGLHMSPLLLRCPVFLTQDK